MKKIYLMACLIMLLAVTRYSNAQYNITVDSLLENYMPGVVTIYGNTEATGTSADEKQVKIHRAHYTVSVDFKSGSQVIKNWNKNQRAYMEKWEYIRAFSEAIDPLYYMVKNYSGDKSNDSYKTMTKELKSKSSQLMILYEDWNSDMLEQVEGTVKIYDEKQKIFVNEYIFSLDESNKEVLNSWRFQMYSEVRDSKLILTFILDVENLPEIFGKVFPIPGAKI